MSGMASLVRAVVVEVAGEFVEDGHGVAFVVDEHPVGAFGSDAADESLGVTVGSTPSEANTASKDAVYLVSRSRMRNGTG